MNIKSDVTIAETHGTSLTYNDLGEGPNVNYANETNLVGVIKSKNQMEACLSRLSDYKNLVTNNANNIKGLGQKFSNLDQEIAAKVDKYF